MPTECAGASPRGPNTGKPNRTWGGSGESQEPEPSPRRCANVDGFSVHANVSLPAHRRQKLENLCRYMLRPPLAVERLERLESGRLAYRMKTPWRDGTTHVIMSDGELVEKLAALVPAPRFHLVRYFGILASAAKQRPSIVSSLYENPPCLNSCAPGRGYPDPRKRAFHHSLPVIPESARDGKPRSFFLCLNIERFMVWVE